MHCASTIFCLKPPGILTSCIRRLQVNLEHIVHVLLSIISRFAAKTSKRQLTSNDVSKEDGVYSRAMLNSLDVWVCVLKITLETRYKGKKHRRVTFLFKYYFGGNILLCLLYTIYIVIWNHTICRSESQFLHSNDRNYQKKTLPK